MACPLLAFFISDTTPNKIPISPNTKDKLFTIGINDVQIPIIPNTSPAVAKPLFLTFIYIINKSISLRHVECCRNLSNIKIIYIFIYFSIHLF